MKVPLNRDTHRFQCAMAKRQDKTNIFSYILKLNTNIFS